MEGRRRSVTTSRFGVCSRRLLRWNSSPEFLDLDRCDDCQHGCQNRHAARQKQPGTRHETNARAQSDRLQFRHFHKSLYEVIRCFMRLGQEVEDDFGCTLGQLPLTVSGMNRAGNTVCQYHYVIASGFCQGDTERSYGIFSRGNPGNPSG